MSEVQSDPDDELKAEEAQSGDAAAAFDPTASCEQEESEQAVGIGLPIPDSQYDALKENAAKAKRSTDPQSDQSTDDQP